MTWPTFAWTSSGVDLVRHRDQRESCPSLCPSGCRLYWAPSVNEKPIVFQALSTESTAPQRALLYGGLPLWREMEQCCPDPHHSRNAPLIGSASSLLWSIIKFFPTKDTVVAGSNRVFYLTFIVIINWGIHLSLITLMTPEKRLAKAALISKMWTPVFPF